MKWKTVTPLFSLFLASACVPPDDDLEAVDARNYTSSITAPPGDESATGEGMTGDGGASDDADTSGDEGMTGDDEGTSGDGSTSGSDPTEGPADTGVEDYQCGNGILEPGEDCDDGDLVNGDGCNFYCQIEACGAAGAITVVESCETLRAASMGPFVSGLYDIDPDGSGSAPTTEVWCEMDAGSCAYTMVKVDVPDNGWWGVQHEYARACKDLGLEIVVPKSEDHVDAIYDHFGHAANLYNVFPAYEHALGIDDWTAYCQGLECDFWMTDDVGGDVDCRSNEWEPNGDNSTCARIYRRTDGCGERGDWNDQHDTVDYRGWVICSTNDCP